MLGDALGRAFGGEDDGEALAYAIEAGTGAFALGGQAASVLADLVLGASAGTFSLSGIAAGVLYDRLVAAGAGNFALAGQDAAFVDDYLVGAEAGTFALGGQASGLRFDRRVDAAPGAFSLGGVASGLTRTRVLAAEPGAFLLTGNDAGPEILFAGQGAFTLGGQAAGLIRDLMLAAEAGAYTLSGVAADLSRIKTILAGAGSFALTGNAVEFLVVTTKLDLINALRIRESVFSLGYGQQLSPLGGLGGARGEALRRPLWRARLVTTVMDHGTASNVEALIDLLDGAIGSVYIWNPKKKYPAADPTGSTIADSTVTILDVDFPDKLRLQGLPAGYVLTRGDFLHFDVGSSRALHRIGETVAADGSGNTGFFRVTPVIRAGAAAGQTVSLALPAAEMFIVPNSLREVQRSTLHDEIEFEAVQVI